MIHITDPEKDYDGKTVPKVNNATKAVHKGENDGKAVHKEDYLKKDSEVQAEYSKEDNGVQIDNSSDYFIPKENYDLLFKHVKSTENRLSRYEEVNPFYFTTFTSKSPTKIFQNPTKDSFIDEEDEKFHKTIKKLGEGSTSISFKINDKRNGRIMCKKVLKINKDTTFKNAQNAIKEFEILHQINHPCICKSIGINMQEKSEDEKVTTISIFLEYLEFHLKECFENDYLMNIMKVKIVVEVAFGMSHIHKLGLIHRDLKMSNIMLNGNFESKIIDFELVH